MKTSNIVVLISVVLAAALFADPAFATNNIQSVDLNQRVQSWTGLINNTGFLVQALIALLGLIVMCIGLYGCYKMNDQNPGNFTWGKAIGGAIVGALMLFVPLTLGTLGQTLFGTTNQGSPIRVAPGN